MFCIKRHNKHVTQSHPVLQAHQQLCQSDLDKGYIVVVFKPVSSIKTFTFININDLHTTFLSENIDPINTLKALFIPSPQNLDLEYKALKG